MSACSLIALLLPLGVGGDRAPCDVYSERHEAETAHNDAPEGTRSRRSDEPSLHAFLEELALSSGDGPG